MRQSRSFVARVPECALAIGGAALLLACSGQFAMEEAARDDGGAPPASSAGDGGSAPLATLDGGVDASATPDLDELLSNEAIYDLLRGTKYRGKGFRKVNDEPFPSTVAPDKSITLWVSEAGYEAFAKVSPEESGTNVALPVGTVIVREVLAGENLDTITAMVRLADGAFPLGGNWWYAAADPDGTIRKNAQTGAPTAGLLESCGTCHLRRSHDDYLFGTPEGYGP